MTDLNEILVFVKVAEKGSFIGAARALKMPTATVSRRIASLEARLDTQLLQRTTRNVGLTHEGERLYLRAAPVIREALEVEQTVLATRQQPKGLLRITSTPLFAKAYLMPVASRYLQRYPEVEVDIVATTQTINLIEEGFDLGIRAGKLQDSSLIARRLSPGHSVICASPDYLARHGKPEKAADLLAHECILFAPSGRKSTDWHLETLDGPLTLTVNGRLKLNSHELACHAAIQGAGIAKIPAFVAAPEIKAGRLCSLLDNLTPSPLFLNAVYPSQRQLSVKVRQFIDLLVEYIETEQAAQEVN
jgi:DNA-binding transcriptional LysR family regulator